MRIGIDIDGVLTNIAEFNRNYGSKFCYENNIDYNVKTDNYDLYKMFDISKEDGDVFWDEHLEFYSKTEDIRPFAKDIIKKLKEEGNEIYIITARYLTNRDDEAGENMRNIVRNWLSEKGVVYDKLIFSKADMERKTDEINDNEIDLMIEDNPQNINELSEIIPVICYDTSYNKECHGNNIIRCYSWYDIYKKIKEIY